MVGKVGRIESHAGLSVCVRVSGGFPRRSFVCGASHRYTRSPARGDRIKSLTVTDFGWAGKVVMISKPS
jgi:hypothetical protein